MSPRVIVYQAHDHHRSAVICDAMSKGLDRHGIRYARKFETEYTEGLESDIAIFYGLEGRLSKVFRAYSEQGHAVYIDLGYWKRKEHKNRFGGYHKVVVNDRHPTAYFQNRCHDDSRASIVGVEIEKWKETHYGKHVLLAGMGDKGAKAEGYEVEEWERWAIKQIREHTRRHIVYRPKPSWKRARPIQGVGYSGRAADVKRALDSCHCVVTHHSNVAVDGLTAGIPCFVWKGVAAQMGLQDFSKIEEPMLPVGREQWVNDIAWCQWNPLEMANGDVWNYLTQEGLL